ncbi:MAG: alpha/beta fold hydrolase [Acidimicrobiales bacterium]
MTATEASAGDRTADLHVEEWGEGTRVVLVHGSLAVAAEEWAEQVPLADEGFHLVAPDRRGHGSSPEADGEDYLVDAADVEALMGDGAHLVAHSYGGLGAMFAAAHRPEATRSLTLLEPAAFGVALDHPAAGALVDEVRTLWDAPTDDAEFVVAFLRAVGSDPDAFPPEFLEAALPLVPVFRNGRRFWEAQLPLDDIAAATYPKVVVSGGHHPAFEAMCDALADRIGAERVVVEGAGHEIQFTGEPINEVLRSVWR